MRQTLRKISALFLVFVLTLTSQTVYASEAEAGTQVTQDDGQGAVEPRYVNTIRITADLRFDGSTAHCYSSVTAKKVCHISVVMRLQRKDGNSWNTLVSWVESADGPSKSMSKTFALSTHGQYRTYAVFNVGGEELTYASATRTY